MIHIAEKQKHVGEVAKRDPGHRFKGLYRTLCEEAWLTEAWTRIRPNKGSATAGVDGQTRDDVDGTLIKRLADKLKKEEYQPTPVRRVYIPKANGKTRPLGIPMVASYCTFLQAAWGLRPLISESGCEVAVLLLA